MTPNGQRPPPRTPGDNETKAALRRALAEAERELREGPGRARHPQPAGSTDIPAEPPPVPASPEPAPSPSSDPSASVVASTPPPGVATSSSPPHETASSITTRGILNAGGLVGSSRCSSGSGWVTRKARLVEIGHL